jgi:hypothetical protein
MIAKNNNTDNTKADHNKKDRLPQIESTAGLFRKNKTWSDINN